LETKIGRNGCAPSIILRKLMRAANLIAILFIGLSGMAAGDEFERANGLFDEGKFTEAKEIYEQMVGARTWSANLFYNLGNADFRLGAPGVAALNYERALALSPAHPEAAMNLKLLRDQTGARIWPSSWRDRLFPKSAMRFYGVTAVAAFWIVVFSALLIRARRGRGGFATTMILCLAALTGIYAAFGTWHWLPETSMAIVTARQTEARRAPAERAARGEVLPAGSRVRIKSERGEWVYCGLPGGGLGWIPAHAIAKVRLPGT
jgi:tetratricopeptide (TPR) repeat protein